MKMFISSLLLLASGGGNNSVTTAFSPTTTCNRPSDTKLSSSRYNNDYYRDYSNNNNYRNNNNNNSKRYDNYVMDRNAGRFDNSVGSATYGSTSIGGRRYNNNKNRSFGSSYDSYYRGPYDRVGSSENFRLTSSPNSRKMRSDYYYDDYDTNNNYYNTNNNNNYVTQRRGGYADDIGGRSRYSTPMYSNGGYASPQGLSEDFRTGREGPVNSMTSRQRRERNWSNSNRIQDYYTPGEREWMSQRQNSGLRYGWQQQYDRERGNVRMGSGEDFRRGSSLSRISDYFTPLERERRQMSDNRVLGRGGSYGNDGYYQQYGSNRGGSGGVKRGGYYDDYPNYGFDSYDDEYDDYFENDGGYSSGSRQRGRRNRNTWDNLLNMFRN